MELAAFQQDICKNISDATCRQTSFLTPYLENEGYICIPWRFQWIVTRKLAVMAWPQYPEHLRFLLKSGIRRLVCLSPETRPPVHAFTEFYYMEIPVEELEAPTLDNIKLFICFVEQALEAGEPVGICCRVGRGRCGVLAACYMVRFCGMNPSQAIVQLRTVRPFSIDTVEQEHVIAKYYEELVRCPPESYPCARDKPICPKDPSARPTPC